MKTLVVGGNSGIGEEIYRWLQEQDERAFYDRLYRPHPGELDVTDEVKISSYIKEHGPFSGIIYTPGVNELEWANDLTMGSFIEPYKVNVFGFALLLAAHRRAFPAECFSAVALVSDAMRNPMRGSTVYCSSKAALAAVIRNLAREWAPECRVNGVAPAIVADTPMTKYIDERVPSFRGWEPEKAAAYERLLLPMGRRVEKIEVARVVADVLYGPDYLTGSIIDITGGK